MSQEFFTNLPSHITIDILSRLPIPTILRCKSVCKPWLHLLNSHEFTTHHLSESAPGLAVFQSKITSEIHEIYEFEDELDLDVEHRYKLLTAFKLPSHGLIQGSANGLLLIMPPEGLSICNPITREYMDIRTPQDSNYKHPQKFTFGFGVSTRTRQYKVVMFSHDPEKDKRLGFLQSECHVYTLGTGSWRRSAAPCLSYGSYCNGAFLNGNLHWLGFDANSKAWISCFDLETELLSTISPPTTDQQLLVADVFAFGDKLCVCDSWSEDEIVVWLMEEYGDEKSWRKEFVVVKREDMYGECVVRPIKVFKDGEMAMLWGDFFVFHWCSKRGTVSEMRMFEARGNCALDLIPHTPTFLSLSKSFGAMENVSS
ncbi:F-box protein At3g07870-like [Salvia hispanica]|uniref:F-box protein At3g07870-like n=1 Tax=Salvia hispanica TaxID=49212 RepID=UPI00200900E2|nr:F-box protein At3g07870-like [Salvia hispanica]